MSSTLTRIHSTGTCSETSSLRLVIQEVHTAIAASCRRAQRWDPVGAPIANCESTVVSQSPRTRTGWCSGHEQPRASFRAAGGSRALPLHPRRCSCSSRTCLPPARRYKMESRGTGSCRRNRTRKRCGEIRKIGKYLVAVSRLLGRGLQGVRQMLEVVLPICSQ